MKGKKTISLEKIIKILLLGMLIATIATGVYFTTKKGVSDIINVEYTESGGFAGDHYNVKIRKNIIQKMTLTINSKDKKENFTKVIDDNFMLQLKKLINKYNINSWDGYNYTERALSDGFSESFKIVYGDGSEVKISYYGFAEEDITLFISDFRDLVNDEIN